MDNHSMEIGFSNHIQNQLQQAAQQVTDQHRGRGRGRARGRGRGHHHRGGHAYANMGPPPYQVPPSVDGIPPLSIQGPGPSQEVGTTEPYHQQFVQQPTFPYHPHHSQHYQQQQHPAHHHHGHAQTDPREFFDRSRGMHRGGGGRHSHHHPRAQYANHPNHQLSADFRRPPVHRGHLYQPNMNPHFGTADQQRAFRQRVMVQSDYLNSIQNEARSQHQLKSEEKQLKEAFRKHLERLFQDTLSANHTEISIAEVKLKCYGSLNNGFGLAGCDMDLLLTLPEALAMRHGLDMDDKKKIATNGDVLQGSTPVLSESKTAIAPEALQPIKATASDEPGQVESFETGRLLEAALLNSGYGARLLTNTRVPILKICEKPSVELLENLKEYRKHEERLRTQKSVTKTQLHVPPVLDLAQLTNALENLENQELAADIPLPDTPSRDAASLEFAGDCGIQCDVNFSNLVAIHNTRLLREYCRYDERVAYMGVFIKAWAKVRDINTPYWGTLSSYGYVLLVLHYLMNVASPPVIPNLQYLAQQEDTLSNNANVELFEGKFDIRFLSDDAKIANIRASSPRNHDSTGNLLRGFFAYYADPSGFHWNNEIISLRTMGGVLTKRSKGWTEAKWTGQNQSKNVRLRYLLAIEDPFEVDHNVARTVGHNGIVAIRDEFRRAWHLIQKIGGDEPVEDLLNPAEKRGDTLRKDQEFHKQKVKQMRLQLEAKELALQKQALEEAADAQDVDGQAGSKIVSIPVTD